MKSNQGFTLIEIMIVVVIIGILASIAYPSYSEYVRRGNRAEGQSYLLDIAARQERYYAQNNSYVTHIDDIGNLGATASSETGKYNLSLSGNNRFTLTATPTFADPRCGSFTLNARGEKNMAAHNGVTGTKNDCWK